MSPLLFLRSGNFNKVKHTPHPFIFQILFFIIHKIVLYLVIQLSGDLIEGGLVEYYPFILTSGTRRYYCPEAIYNTFEEGFIHSWVSFDFNKDVLKEMPFNKANVQVDGFIIASDLSDTYNTFFKPEWSHKNLESLLKQSNIYFSTDNDFEYFGVASRIPMETIIKKWQEGLDLYDQEQQEIQGQAD